MRRKGGKGPSGTVCGVVWCGCVWIPRAGVGQSNTEAFLPPRHAVDTGGRDRSSPSVLGQPEQGQSLQQIPGQVEAAHGQQHEQRIWGLCFPSLTQTLNKVEARCGPIHLPDPEGKSHLRNNAFKTPPGPGAHSHCAMFSCNLSRLKTHLTKCKEGSALISSGKGQK